MLFAVCRDPGGGELCARGRDADHPSARKREKRAAFPSAARRALPGGALRRTYLHRRGGAQQPRGQGAVRGDRAHPPRGDQKRALSGGAGREGGGKGLRRQEPGCVPAERRSVLRQALPRGKSPHPRAESRYVPCRDRGQGLCRPAPRAQKAQRVCDLLRCDRLHRLRPHQPVHGGGQGKAHSGERAGGHVGAHSGQDDLRPL